MGSGSGCAESGWLCWFVTTDMSFCAGALSERLPPLLLSITYSIEGFFEATRDEALYSSTPSSATLGCKSAREAFDDASFSDSTFWAAELSVLRPAESEGSSIAATGFERVVLVAVCDSRDLAVSADLLDLREVTDLVGLTGPRLSSFPAFEGADVNEAFGETRTESRGVDGSTTLLRCQKRAGELGLLLLVSSSGRDAVLVNL